MRTDIFIKETYIYECAKLHKDVNKLLQDFEENSILQEKLTNSEKYVIRRFLLKELGCLKGIVEKHIEQEEQSK